MKKEKKEQEFFSTSVVVNIWHSHFESRSIFRFNEKTKRMILRNFI